MDQIEVINLVQILKRRIYHENIQFYENYYYNLANEKKCKTRNWHDKNKTRNWKTKNGKFKKYYENLVIPPENYSDENLKNAILKGENLNLFGMVNGKQCVYSDLNNFFSKVKEARRLPVNRYIEMLNFCDIDQNSLNYVFDFFQYHTELENLVIKIEFLKMANIDINNLGELEIDILFDKVVNNIRNSEEMVKLNF